MRRERSRAVRLGAVAPTPSNPDPTQLSSDASACGSLLAWIILLLAQSVIRITITPRWRRSTIGWWSRLVPRTLGGRTGVIRPARGQRFCLGLLRASPTSFPGRVGRSRRAVRAVQGAVASSGTAQTWRGSLAERCIAGRFCIHRLRSQPMPGVIPLLFARRWVA